MRRGLAWIATYASLILDDVLMPSARTVRTNARHVEEIAPTPTTHTLLHVRITTLAPYHDSVVSDMIHSLKYDGNTHAARLAAALLTDYLREEVAEHTRFSTHPILLIPLPLHPARERERGFNQMARVLSELPREFHDGTLARIELNALERVHYRIPQTKLPRAARIKNVRGAFVCSNPKSITNTHIFLIDDVATTGATLASAAEALEAHGAHVSPIALARA